ncbi:MAG: TetR/AcrR family transcriptional regulator [Lachnospiraceae bacterium]|nr:TetR/AcrR family transcriptional regulator [Lachnospiraceae bacterium]
MAKELTNRQKGAIETRKKILEAARRAILEKGFDRVSVSDIAKEAGVATGSFYTYFKRKEDIIEELNKTDFSRLAEIVNQMKGKSIVEKLDNYCRVYMKAVERSGLEICRQWLRNHISASAENGTLEATKYQYDYQAMQSVLNEAVKQGQLKEETPVDALAFLINSQLYGFMLVWCMTDGKVVGSEQTRNYCLLMLKKSIEPYLPAVPKAEK